MGDLKTGVVEAIDAIKKHFADSEVQVIPAPNGGAHIIIENVHLGPPYVQDTTWVGFYLSDACPFDDTYPFYVVSDLSRLDGADLKAPIHINQQFPADGSSANPQKAVMVSRRQNNQSSLAHETPLLKLKTVLRWMLQQ